MEEWVIGGEPPIPQGGRGDIYIRKNGSLLDKLVASNVSIDPLQYTIPPLQLFDVPTGEGYQAWLFASKDSPVTWPFMGEPPNFTVV